MAASYDNPRREVHSTRTVGSLAGLELSDRLAEEIARAERHSTRLSCLLLVVENLDAMAREHGFDRIGRPAEGDGDLLILLPGADGPQAEIVARRVLERLRTVKLESGGQRAPLRLSVGLAAWREPSTAEDLFDLAHAAAVRPNGNGNGGGS
jgi:hypothetical protein